jgi:hypothetical protein
MKEPLYKGYIGDWTYYTFLCHHGRSFNIFFEISKDMKSCRYKYEHKKLLVY